MSRRKEAKRPFKLFKVDMPVPEQIQIESRRIPSMHHDNLMSWFWLILVENSSQWRSKKKTCWGKYEQTMLHQCRQKRGIHQFVVFVNVCEKRVCAVNVVLFVRGERVKSSKCTTEFPNAYLFDSTPVGILFIRCKRQISVINADKKTRKLKQAGLFVKEMNLTEIP